MKSTRLAVAAALLALASGATWAENQAITVPLLNTTPGTYSTGFSLTHLMAGPFTDTISFTPDLSGTISAGVFTFGFTPATDINFSSASLNGQPLLMSGTGSLETGLLSPTFLTGPYVLTVSGVAGFGLPDDTAITASYSGTANVTAAVPESGTLVLLMAGLGAIGFVVRRRLD